MPQRDRQVRARDLSLLQLQQDSVVSLVLNIEPIDTPDSVELKIITRHGSDILFKARAAFLETDIAAEYGITSTRQIRFLGVSSSLWVDTIERSGDIDIAWGGGPVVFDLVNSEGMLLPLTYDPLVELMDQIPDEISGAPSKRYNEDESIKSPGKKFCSIPPAAFVKIKFLHPSLCVIKTGRMHSLNL